MSGEPEIRDVDVLIVGGGPVGTALAIELGSRGIACEVLERRTSSTPQPKAKLTNVRTMTLLRRWGLADRVRAAAPLPPTFPSDIAFVTRMTGWELVRFPNAMSTAPDRERPYPEPAQQIPQDALERVLRERAMGLPHVTWSAGVTAERIEDAGGYVLVDATETATRTRRRHRCRYLAGCDGARSSVRRDLDIGMDGDDVLAHNVSAVFHAPTLWSVHDKAPAVQYWTVNDDFQAVLGPLDGVDTWWFHLIRGGDGRMSEDEIRTYFHRAVGAEFPCEVVAHGPWTAQRLLARRYRSGRVFLLGDAAHLHPPTGGYGMNMGIGDAVDLGWKLAATVQGWGGRALLDSYEAERRPVHKRVVDEAAHNFASGPERTSLAGLEDAGSDGDRTRRVTAVALRDKAREFASLGVQLGYRYEGSPIVVRDGSAPTADAVSTYVPTARPGHLAPHGWLDERRCLYDLLGPGFTLLRLGASPPDAEPLVRAAAAAGMPLLRLDLPGSGLLDLFGAPLVLVRPDQHVAWRGDVPGDPATLVDIVRGGRPDDDRTPDPAGRPELGSPSVS